MDKAEFRRKIAAQKFSNMVFLLMVAAVVTLAMLAASAVITPILALIVIIGMIVVAIMSAPIYIIYNRNPDRE